MTLLYQHKSGLTRKEIAQNSKLNGKFLNTILENLEQCDFIAKMELFGRESTMVYRLVDFYTLFYFKFIAENINSTGSGGAIILTTREYGHGRD